MAYGCSKCLNIEINKNFHLPYYSTSVKEFWNRWHISLSTWLKKYIYFSLGGSRHGKIRKYINIFITFLISGIWHGVGLNFIVWGLMLAGMMVFSDLTKRYRKKIKIKLHINQFKKLFNVFNIIFVFTLITITWIFFRSNSVMDALVYIKHSLNISLDTQVVIQQINEFGYNFYDFIFIIIAITCIQILDYLRVKYDLYESFCCRSMIFRWTIYFISILTIITIGIYGPSFDISTFIYGNF